MILAFALAATLASQSTPTPEQTPQEKMDTLQQVYDESCGNRGYGEYDDVCNSISAQIREARRELRKQLSKRKSDPAAPPTATTPTPPDDLKAVGAPPK